MGRTCYWQVVLQRLRESRYLKNKGTKINIGKYHHATTVMREDLPLFSTKAYLLGYVCHAFGKQLEATVQAQAKHDKPEVKEAVPGSASGSAEALAPASALSLKQVSFAATELSHGCRNQLDKAAVEYGSMANYYKQKMILDVLNITAKWSNKSSQDLRTVDAAIKWEIEMLKGGAHYHNRLTLHHTQMTKWFDDYGIEATWAATELHLLNVRILVSDGFAGLLWSLCFSVVKFSSDRKILMTEGYPRRLTLLLDAESRDAEIKQFRTDADLHEEFMKIDDDDDVMLSLKQRSLFHKMTVRQVDKCLQEESCIWTPRLE